MAKYISKNQIHKLISILMVISLIGTVSIILSGCTSKLSDDDIKHISKTYHLHTEKVCKKYGLTDATVKGPSFKYEVDDEINFKGYTSDVIINSKKFSKFSGVEACKFIYGVDSDNYDVVDAAGLDSEKYGDIVFSAYVQVKSNGHVYTLFDDDDFVYLEEDEKDIVKVKMDDGDIKDVIYDKFHNNYISKKKHTSKKSAKTNTDSGSDIGDLTKVTNTDTKVKAWVCAQDVVRSELKSPSSAKFCSSPDATVYVDKNDKYLIIGSVESENSYGAMLKQDFVVTLELTKEGYTNGSVKFK